MVCGDVVSVRLPAWVDVDEGINGEGESVYQVMADCLSDLVTLANREVGINGGDKRDEHAMPVPAHPDAAH